APTGREREDDLASARRACDGAAPEVPLARRRFELDEFVSDPFAMLRRAREAGPVVELAAGGPGVTTYERVRELMADRRLRANFPDFLRTFGVGSGPFYDWMAVSPLNLDGPEHQRWRAFMSRTFTPR